MKGIKLILPNVDFTDSALSYGKVTNGTSSASYIANGTTTKSFVLRGTDIIQASDSDFVTNLTAAFKTSPLIELDLSIWNGITELKQAFWTNTTIQKVDLSSVDLSGCKSASRLFQGCTGLLSVTFGIANAFASYNDADGMANMFSNCLLLMGLDLSSFDTSLVTSMFSMFIDCQSLVELDLSSFNTAAVVNMGSMFTRCYAIESLDLSSFNTSSVTNMSYMFANMSALKTLNLDNFNTDAVTTYDNMFRADSVLERISVANCNATTKAFLIARLADAGYTFSESTSGVLTKTPN